MPCARQDISALTLVNAYVLLRHLPNKIEEGGTNVHGEPSVLLDVFDAYLKGPRMEAVGIRARLLPYLFVSRIGPPRPMQEPVAEFDEGSELLDNAVQLGLPRLVSSEESKQGLQ